MISYLFCFIIFNSPNHEALVAPNQKVRTEQSSILQ